MKDTIKDIIRKGRLSKFFRREKVKSKKKRSSDDSWLRRWSKITLVAKKRDILTINKKTNDRPLTPWA